MPTIIEEVPTLRSFEEPGSEDHVRHSQLKDQGLESLLGVRVSSPYIKDSNCLRFNCQAGVVPCSVGEAWASCVLPQFFTRRSRSHGMLEA